jgi:polar amino acid transport system substrate-binding protein
VGWLRIGTCLLLTLLCCPAFGQTLRINCAQIYPRSTPEQTGFQDEIVKEAFGRIGITVGIVHLPSERALQNVNMGVDDGNFARVAGLEAKYPNLVMVPEKITDFYFTVFTKDPALVASSFADLKTKNVTIVIGWKILEDNLAGTKKLTKLKNGQNLFDFLANDRCDAVVFDRLEGLEIIREEGLAGIRAVVPPLATLPMYLYLNKRHADLVAPLASALTAMRLDETTERLTRDALADVSAP